MINITHKHSAENFRIRSIERTLFRTDFFPRQRSLFQRGSCSSMKKINIKLEPIKQPLKQITTNQGLNINQIIQSKNLKRIYPKKLHKAPKIFSSNSSPYLKKKLLFGENIEKENIVKLDDLILQDEDLQLDESYRSAFDPVSGKMIVVKKVSGSSCSKQIRMVKQLKHENILYYYAPEKKEKDVYFYSQSMPAGNLKQMIDSIGPLNAVLIQKIMKQLVNTLDYIHFKKYIVHNLSSSKILLDGDGNIKLLLVSSETNNSLYDTFPLKKMICKSPQTILNNQTTSKSNIWTVGCIALQMITKQSRLAFDGQKLVENTKQFIECLKSQKKVFVPNYISSKLKNFISLCLQYDADLRPEASELLKSSFLMSNS